MTDRPIIYTGSQPRSADILQGWKDAHIGDGALATILAGTCGGAPSTVFKGLDATATTPPSMTIHIGPGIVLSPAVVDLTPYSTLGTDTTHSTTKVGINQDKVDVVFSAPTSNPQVFVIEARLATYDAGGAVLKYYDSEDTSQVYNGPNNSGTSQFTRRLDACQFNVVQGAPASSPETPPTDTGWIGLYIVTIPANAGAVTQNMITRHPSAKFMDLSLCDLQTGGSGGSQPTVLTAGTGLTGGTSTGTISIANTGVLQGTYDYASVTVNPQGQITNIHAGVQPTGSTGTVTSITAGAGLTGGTITTSGIIALPAVGANTTVTNANLTIDAYGRVIAATNGSSGSGGQIDYQPQINSLSTSINSTTTHLTTIDGQITTINGRLTTIDGQVTTLNNQLGSLGSINSHLILIDGQITTINNTLSTHTTHLNLLDTEFSSLQGQITSINGQITTINSNLSQQSIRYRLQSTLNIYVNGTSGNDANAINTVSGFTPSPQQSVPFRTLQTAWSTVMNRYDLSGQIINFFVTDGTYTAGIKAAGMVGNSQTGSVNIIGNVNTPGNCVINVAANNCFDFAEGISVNISGFRLSASSAPNDPTLGYAIAAGVSQVQLNAIEFGACGSGHIVSYTGGYVYVKRDGFVRILGGAPKHADVRPGGAYSSAYGSVLFNAGINFADCVYGCVNGAVTTYWTNFNNTQGNVTGVRYNVSANGILDNGGTPPDSGPATAGVFGAGSLLPGSINGSTSKGGQVIDGT